MYRSSAPEDQTTPVEETSKIRIIYSLTLSGDVGILRKHTGITHPNDVLYCCEGDPVPISIQQGIKLLKDTDSVLIKIIDLLYDRY